MPSLASFHPVIVHFAIGLAVAGVLLRWLWLSGRVGWAGPAAAALLLTSAVVVFAAARSGVDAHGPVERVPGSAQVVSEHEDWGNLAYRAFVVVGLLELLALALRSRGRAKPVLVASALAAAESLLLDRKAAAVAVAALERTSVPPDDGRLRMRRAFLRADAFESEGNKPAALSALEQLSAESPQNERLKKRIEQLRFGR